MYPYNNPNNILFQQQQQQQANNTASATALLNPEQLQQIQLQKQQLQQNAANQMTKQIDQASVINGNGQSGMTYMAARTSIPDRANETLFSTLYQAKSPPTVEQPETPTPTIQQQQPVIPTGQVVQGYYPGEEVATDLPLSSLFPQAYGSTTTPAETDTPAAGTTTGAGEETTDKPVAEEKPTPATTGQGTAATGGDPAQQQQQGGGVAFPEPVREPKGDPAAADNRPEGVGSRGARYVDNERNPNKGFGRIVYDGKPEFQRMTEEDIEKEVDAEIDWEKPSAVNAQMQLYLDEIKKVDADIATQIKKMAPPVDKNNPAPADVLGRKVLEHSLMMAPDNWKKLIAPVYNERRRKKALLVGGILGIAAGAAGGSLKESAAIALLGSANAYFNDPNKARAKKLAHEMSKGIRPENQAKVAQLIDAGNFDAAQQIITKDFQDYEYTSTGKWIVDANGALVPKPTVLTHAEKLAQITAANNAKTVLINQAKLLQDKQKAKLEVRNEELKKKKALQKEDTAKVLKAQKELPPKFAAAKLIQDLLQWKRESPGRELGGNLFDAQSNFWTQFGIRGNEQAVEKALDSLGIDLFVEYLGKFGTVSDADLRQITKMSDLKNMSEATLTAILNRMLVDFEADMEASGVVKLNNAPGVLPGTAERYFITDPKYSKVAYDEKAFGFVPATQAVRIFDMPKKGSGKSANVTTEGGEGSPGAEQKKGALNRPYWQRGYQYDNNLE